MSTGWDDLFRRWSKTPHGDPQTKLVREARRRARKGGDLNDAMDWQWVRDSLDDQRKWFVAEVFNVQSTPKPIARAILAAGVAEKNPSASRWLVEPAQRTLGAREVVETLLILLRTGSSQEKAGAASAMYWVDTSDGGSALDSLRLEWRDEMLKQFLESRDLSVRQRILPGLSMNKDSYSADLAVLVDRAIQSAKSDPDDYIRHRIEVQLGATALLKPLPSQ